MAGGNWTAQSKVRPGAYINVKTIPAPVGVLGTRGVLALPVMLPWGPEDEVIAVEAGDFIGGKAKARIGLGYEDTAEAAMFLRQGFAGAYRALLYRVNGGAARAAASESGFSLEARYAGSLGNRLAVAVLESGDKVDVVTLLDAQEVDRQRVSSIDELADNGYVVFDGEGIPPLHAGIALTGGSDGAAANVKYAAFYAALEGQSWNTLALPEGDEARKAQTLAFIKARRNAGQKVQAVLVDYPQANHEGIISVSQGFSTSAGDIPAAGLAVYVAGLTAGGEVTQSYTYHVVQGATDILGELDAAGIEKALLGGEMILTRRMDGAIVIEQDINTLHEYTPEKGRVFAKNRVLRCLDDIATVARLKFELHYIGKMNNDARGRNLFKSDLAAYIGRLQAAGAVEDFDAAEDILVRLGDEADSVLVEMTLRPVDAMEKLYMMVQLDTGSGI